MIVCVTEIFEYCSDTATYLVDIDKLPPSAVSKKLIEAFIKSDKTNSLCRVSMEYSDFQSELETHNAVVNAPQMVDVLVTVYFD